jgi:hypothetical protein
MKFIGLFLLNTPLALFIALVGDTHGLPAWFRIILSYLGLFIFEGCIIFGVMFIIS